MYLGVVFNGEHVEFMLIDDLGNIHGKQVEHSVDLLYDGPHGFRGMIESGIARICLKAGIGFREIVYAYFAVPEYGEHQEYDEALNEVLQEVFPKDNYVCENDVEAAMTAAFGIKQGIVVLIGAGSIALAKNYKHESSRSGGWGRVAGDEAGEYWFARKILEIFTKEADGRYATKVLYKHLRQKMSLKDDIEIINFSVENLENYGLTFEVFLGILFEAYELGDPYAKQIIDKGVEEIVLMIESLASQMEFMRPINVALVGRLFSELYPIKECVHRELGMRDDFCFWNPRLSLVSGAALKALMFKRNITEIVIRNLIQEESRLLSLRA